ncbi:MAG: hypothetical protein GY822_31790, partial [Deltaproteobacteria bacterium]|nr:hypothetical protein [Deltaproteobacteria bacterium]
MATLALFLTLVLTPAQAPADVQIRTSHPKIKIGAVTFHQIRPGKAMKIQVNRKAGEQLALDVIRLGKPAQKGKARISVRVGRKEQKLNVRAKLEDTLAVGNGILASYPVRHRVDLPFKANAVRITVVDGTEGVAVRVFTSKQKRSRLNVASIGLDKKTKKNRKKRKRRGKRRSKKTKKAAQVAEKTDAATTEKTDAATTEKTDAATTEKTGDGSATKKTDAATTEKTGDGSAAEKTGDGSATEKTDAATTEKTGDGSAAEKTDTATTEKTDA